MKSLQAGIPRNLVNFGVVPNTTISCDPSLESCSANGTATASTIDQSVSYEDAYKLKLPVYGTLLCMSFTLLLTGGTYLSVVSAHWVAITWEFLSLVVEGLLLLLVRLGVGGEKFNTSIKKWSPWALIGNGVLGSISLIASTSFSVATLGYDITILAYVFTIVAGLNGYFGSKGFIIQTPERPIFPTTDDNSSPGSTPVAGNNSSSSNNST